MLTSVLTPRVPRLIPCLIPRLTASRNDFLARSTALSWPWNKDRLRAAPGTMPPSFADLTLGLADRTRPVIRVWCKDPMQRDDDKSLPLRPAGGGEGRGEVGEAAELRTSSFGRHHSRAKPHTP